MLHEWIYDSTLDDIWGKVCAFVSPTVGLGYVKLSKRSSVDHNVVLYTGKMATKCIYSFDWFYFLLNVTILYSSHDLYWNTNLHKLLLLLFKKEYTKDFYEINAISVKQWWNILIGIRSPSIIICGVRAILCHLNVESHSSSSSLFHILLYLIILNA